MRYLAGILLLVLSVTASAAAQGRSPGPAAGRGMFADIVLTPEQERQVDSIRARHQEVRDAMRASRQPGTMPDSARIQMRTAMREQQRQAYRAILTPEQQKVFDRNVERMRQGDRPCPAGPGRGGGRRGGPPAGA